MRPEPAKKLVIVTCMDVRLHLNRIFGLVDGDAHVLRNAGGVVTDDVVRSLIISQRLLGTEEVYLLHHTDCGALKFTDDALRRELYEETGIRPPFALEAFGDPEDDVRQSMARIEASPFLRSFRVRGFVYDVGTWRLSEVLPLG